jgi:hypothetical protein
MRQLEAGIARLRAGDDATLRRVVRALAASEAPSEVPGGRVTIWPIKDHLDQDGNEEQT